VDEVQADAVHDGPEVGEVVDGGLLGSPVKAGLPPADQLPQERRAGAVLPAGPVQLGRPAGAGQPLGQVVQGGLGTVSANRSTPQALPYRRSYPRRQCPYQRFRNSLLQAAYNLRHDPARAGRVRFEPWRTSPQVPPERMSTSSSRLRSMSGTVAPSAA
jgi:hypothetical protein